MQQISRRQQETKFPLVSTISTTQARGPQQLKVMQMQTASGELDRSQLYQSEPLQVPS
jgi:hypothetical protein